MLAIFQVLVRNGPEFLRISRRKAAKFTKHQFLYTSRASNTIDSKRRAYTHCNKNNKNKNFVMWDFMRIVCSTVLILGFLKSCNVVALDPTPPAPLQISVDHIYLQDFNSLQAEENNNNNINNIPFPPAAMQGWWGNKPTYGLSNGSLAAGGLFSFGVDDDDDDHHQTNDRSLGSLTSGQVRHISYGAVFSLPSDVDDDQVPQKTILHNSLGWRFNT